MTTRLGEPLVKELKTIAKTEHLDNSEVMRRLLAGSIERWRQERALKLYHDGVFSFGQAFTFAKVSPWRFTDLLKEHKVPLNLDQEEIEKEFKRAGWS